MSDVINIIYNGYSSIGWHRLAISEPANENGPVIGWYNTIYAIGWRPSVFYEKVEHVESLIFFYKKKSDDNVIIFLEYTIPFSVSFLI